MSCSELECSVVKDAIPLSHGERKGINTQHPMGTDSEYSLVEKLPKRSGEQATGATRVEHGFKRARTTDDQQPSVHISYKYLSSESKRKLEELLHQWSEWQSQQCPLLKDSEEDLDSGEETFFPALQVGPDNSSRPLAFYMDSQVKKKQRTENVSFDSASVPLYDREYAFALTSGGDLTSKESCVEILNASRCFNCGAYNHSLKECPKPRDNDAVSSARKMHQSSRNRIVAPRIRTRYYQNSPGGKFDGLNPGSLNAETRKLLGLGELDPPPWLNRMREMGYPPGYLDLEEEDQTSGITIFADGISEETIEEVSNLDNSEPKKKMSVAFPGINAPIPENVDQSCWAAPQMPINALMPESVDRTCFAAAQKPTNFNLYSTPLNYRLNKFPCI